MSALLLQISDTHFGVERPPVCAALRRMAHAQKPDVLLLSGDITQRARAEQFGAARAFVDSLDIPQRLTLPGNHDIALFNLAERLFMPYRGYRRAFGPAHDAVLDAEGVRVIGVDSTRRYRHVDGEVSVAQIECTTAHLRAAAPGALRVVMLHHPVAVTRAGEQHNLTHRHADAVSAWRTAGADLILGGHIHLPFVRVLGDTGARRAWAVQAGTSVSQRTRRDAGNSVNLIRVPACGFVRQCVVERWDYESEADAFELAALSTFALDPHP